MSHDRLLKCTVSMMSASVSTDRLMCGGENMYRIFWKMRRQSSSPPEYDKYRFMRWFDEINDLSEDKSQIPLTTFFSLFSWCILLYLVKKYNWEYNCSSCSHSYAVSYSSFLHLPFLFCPLSLLFLPSPSFLTLPPPPLLFLPPCPFLSCVSWLLLW